MEHRVLSSSQALSFSIFNKKMTQLLESFLISSLNFKIDLSFPFFPYKIQKTLMIDSESDEDLVASYSHISHTSRYPQAKSACSPLSPRRPSQKPPSFYQTGTGSPAKRGTSYEIEQLRAEKNVNIQLLLNSIDSRDTEIFNMKKVIQNLQSRVAQKDSLISKSSSDLEESSAALQRLQVENDEMAEHISICEEKLSTAESKVKEMNGRIQEKAKACEAYKRSHESHQELITRMANSLKETNKMVEQLKKEKEELTRSLNGLSGFKSSFESSAQEKTQKEKELERLRKALKDSENEKESLLKKNKEADLTNEQLGRDKESLEEALREKNRIFQELFEKYEMACLEVEQGQTLRVELGTLEKEIEMGKQQSQAKDEQISRLKTSLKSMKQAQWILASDLEEFKKAKAKPKETEIEMVPVPHEGEQRKGGKGPSSSDEFMMSRDEVEMLVREEIEQILRKKDEDEGALRAEIEKKNQFIIHFQAQFEKKEETIENISKDLQKSIQKQKELKEENEKMSKELEILKNNMEQKEEELESIKNEKIVPRRESSNASIQVEIVHGLSASPVLVETNEKDDEFAEDLRESLGRKGENAQVGLEGSTGQPPSDELREKLALELRNTLNENEELLKKVKALQKEADLLQEENDEFDEEVRSLNQKFEHFIRELTDKTYHLNKMNYEYDLLVNRYNQLENQFTSKENESRVLAEKLAYETETFKALLEDRERACDEWHQKYIQSLERIGSMTDHSEMVIVPLGSKKEELNAGRDIENGLPERGDSFQKVIFDKTHDQEEDSNSQNDKTALEDPEDQPKREEDFLDAAE